MAAACARAVDHQRKDDREFHAVWVERLRAPDRRRCGPRPIMKVLWGHHIALRDLISDHPCERGFAVDAVSRADDALVSIAAISYDAAIIDLGLPDMGGLELLTR